MMDTMHLWVGVSLPEGWSTKHGLTERTRWVSPESLFAVLLTEEILKNLPEMDPSHLDVEVDKVTYEGVPSWEVKQPGELVVDAKLDSGVATAFAATVRYLTGP
jgi:hypothetical protein